MNNAHTWLHGTSAYFDQWALPAAAQPQNRGFETHSAIFFTTSHDYALRAAQGTGGICSAHLIKDANVLNMNNCTDEASEEYRLQVLKKNIAPKNPHFITPANWQQAWAAGSAMKFSATSPPLSAEEYTRLKQMAHFAVYEKNTPQGMVAFSALQQLTRTVIEALVTSARELGYDAVIGNEIDTADPTKPSVYEIMFVLNPTVLTPPCWVTKPHQA